MTICAGDLRDCGRDHRTWGRPSDGRSTQGDGIPRNEEDIGSRGNPGPAHGLAFHEAGGATHGDVRIPWGNRRHGGGDRWERGETGGKRQTLDGGAGIERGGRRDDLSDLEALRTHDLDHGGSNRTRASGSPRNEEAFRHHPEI